MKTELYELGAQLTASTPQDTDRLRSIASRVLTLADLGGAVSFLPECIYQNSNIGPTICEDTENENSDKPCSKRCKSPTPYSKEETK